MTTVFICHSHKDQGAALDLEKRLQVTGVDAWIGPRDVAAGEDYAKAIVEALDSAAGVVLVYSENSRASTDCLKELALAQNRELPIFPVRLDDAEIDGGWEYRLQNVQWVQGDLGSLATEIVAQLGPPPQRPQRGSGPEIPYLDMVGDLTVTIGAESCRLEVFCTRDALAKGEPISNAEFDAAVMPLFEELRTLTGILIGHDATSVELGEPERTPFGIRRQIQAPTVAGDWPWFRIECRVQLRGYHSEHTIDDGMIEVHVETFADDLRARSGEARLEPENGSSLAGLVASVVSARHRQRRTRMRDSQDVRIELEDLKRAIRGSVERIAEIVLGARQQGVFARGMDWDPAGSTDPLFDPGDIWGEDGLSDAGAYVISYQIDY